MFYLGDRCRRLVAPSRALLVAKLHGDRESRRPILRVVDILPRSKIAKRLVAKLRAGSLAAAGAELGSRCTKARRPRLVLRGNPASSLSEEQVARAGGHLRSTEPDPAGRLALPPRSKPQQRPLARNKLKGSPLGRRRRRGSRDPAAFFQISEQLAATRTTRQSHNG